MIQFDQRIIGFINIFERITRAKVKDCFEEGDTLTFLVQLREASKAVGKKGENLRKVSKIMKKEIKIIEYNPNPIKFLLNLIYPLRVEIQEKENKLIIKTKDNREKGLIFGREKSKLKRIQKLFKKYFPHEIIIE
ncbi:NusA-like transcription termination signal-binding factor [archaeon]|jgi:transcription termination/antitermination protein NusA|nr:NusA-like transcription termination signal-binding factor [archaeon]MBT3731128.1 NusA-like transcription termination signal-binding factor [archaeon]MBT4670241.1 NusA-like transcription termination signal-binding factor [archaeon]MBT5030470.1 NusA-like transcription termination signal-binding factor [archaeon]MBT5287823.1 NusA-like transcription termination signal-binding factor [archaeon]